MAYSNLLQQMITDVVALTGRPDLESQTVLAIKAATRKLHLSDFFYKDLFETGVSFDSALFEQQLSVKEVVPRFRSVAALRKVSAGIDGSYTGSSYLAEEHITNMLDNYGVAKTDVFYQAGDAIKIKSSTAEQFYILSCYLYPELTDEIYDSWIAREFGEAVMYDAAATVFKTIGFDEQAAILRQETGVWMRELKNSNILNTGV